jgi:hypothetical protein
VEYLHPSRTHNALATSFIFLSTTHYHEADFPWSVTNADSLFRHIQLSYRFIPTSQRFKGCTPRSNHRLSPSLKDPLCRTWEISGIIFGQGYGSSFLSQSYRLVVPVFTFYIPVPPNSRSSARSKLTRLTIQQFHELSTDVYDELVRRKNENERMSCNYI